MMSAEMRMTGMLYYADLDAQLSSPSDVPKAAGMSAIRFSLAVEIPPIALRLQPPLPVSSTCCALPTNHLV